MNERIHELGRQATMWCVDQPNQEDFDVMWEERFAELIVQQCIGVATKRSLHYAHQGDTEKSGAAGSVGLLIAEHFGVKS